MDMPFEPGKELLALAQAYCNRQDLLRVSLNGVELKLHNARALEMALKTGFQMVDEVVAGMLPLVFVPLDDGAITRGRNWYIVEDEEIFSNRLAQVFHKNTVQTVTRKGTTKVEIATDARGAEKKEDVLFGEPGTTRRQGTFRFNVTGHYLESLKITVETAASRKEPRLSSSDTRQIKVELLDLTPGKVPAVDVPDDDAAMLIDRSQRRLSDEVAYTAGLKVIDRSLTNTKAGPSAAVPGPSAAVPGPSNPLTRPPEGYQIATKETPLLPGMPIRLFQGNWQDGEFVAKKDDIFATVSHKLFANRDPIIRQVPWHLIAVSDATLQQGREHPDSFRSSYRLLKDGSLPLEKNWVPLTADTKLVPGTPLHLERAGRWVPAMAVSPAENGRVTVFVLEGPRIRQTLSITEFAVDKATLDQLSAPGAAETFAKSLEQTEAATPQPNIPRRPPRTYPITQPLPAGSEKLAAEATVPKDTKVQIEWARKWYSATVLEESKTGDVMVRWDDFAKWEEPVVRDSLIIDQKLQAKLARATSTALPKAKTPDPAAADNLELVLESFGTGKIAVTKVVMEITGFNLKDAKETVEAAPIVLKDHLSKAEAERFRQQIESAGGKAKVQLKGR
jgi:large subunit ribosomal protein L7/L12